jgi:hypothetical protein
MYVVDALNVERIGRMSNVLIVIRIMRERCVQMQRVAQLGPEHEKMTFFWLRSIGANFR